MRHTKGDANLFDQIDRVLEPEFMPRRARAALGGRVYHALNRGNGRNELFHKPEDYSAFERIMVLRYFGHNAQSASSSAPYEPWHAVWLRRLADTDGEEAAAGIYPSPSRQTQKEGGLRATENVCVPFSALLLTSGL